MTAEQAPATPSRPVGPLVAPKQDAPATANVRGGSTSAQQQKQPEVSYPGLADPRLAESQAAPVVGGAASAIAGASRIGASAPRIGGLLSALGKPLLKLGLMGGTMGASGANAVVGPEGVGAIGGVGGLESIGSGITGAGDVLETLHAVMAAGDTFMSTFPVADLVKTGYELSNSGVLRSRPQGGGKKGAIAPPTGGTNSVCVVAVLQFVSILFSWESRCRLLV